MYDQKKINRLVRKEIKKINILLTESGVNEKRMQMLQPIIENTSLMMVKLEEIRDDVKASEIISEYDNGGGQTGLRENPVFKGYENLWKSYMAGMCKIMDCLPKAVAEAEVEKVEKPQTILEIVRKQKQA